MDIMELVHEDRSAASRPFACGAIGCHKAFARRSDLVRHMRIHSNERPWICDWPGCSRDFIQRSALTVHYRVHTGERPHRCEYVGCDKAFSDSSSLARHRRIHTGKRPYKCPEVMCGKTFCRKTTLTKHIKRNHPDSPAFSHGSFASSDSAPGSRRASAITRRSQTQRRRHDDADYSGTASSPTTPLSVYEREGMYDEDEYEYDDGSEAYYPLPLPPLPDLPDDALSIGGDEDVTNAAANKTPNPNTMGWASPASAPMFVAPSGQLGPNAIRQHLERQDRKKRVNARDPRSAYHTPPPQHPRHMREPSYDLPDEGYNYENGHHQESSSSSSQRHGYAQSYPMTPAASVYSVPSASSPQIGSYGPSSHPLEASWSAPLPSGEFVGAQHYSSMHSSHQPNYYHGSPSMTEAPSPFKAHRRRASSVGALDASNVMVALPNNHQGSSSMASQGFGLGITTGPSDYPLTAGAIEDAASPFRRFSEVSSHQNASLVAASSSHSDTEVHFPTSPEFTHMQHYSPQHQHQQHSSPHDHHQHPHHYRRGSAAMMQSNSLGAYATYSNDANNNHPQHQQQQHRQQQQHHQKQHQHGAQVAAYV